MLVSIVFTLNSLTGDLHKQEISKGLFTAMPLRPESRSGTAAAIWNQEILGNHPPAFVKMQVTFCFILGVQWKGPKLLVPKFRWSLCSKPRTITDRALVFKMAVL